MFRRISLAFLFMTVAALSRGQLPEIAGYAPNALPHNLPLPVEVKGDGVIEQACPVIVYMPSAGSKPILGSTPAVALPGVPVRVAGYQLVVLGQTAVTPLALSDGRLKDCEIPLFAYAPISAGAKPEELVAAIFPPAPPKASPAEGKGSNFVADVRSMTFRSPDDPALSRSPFARLTIPAPVQPAPGTSASVAELALPELARGAAASTPTGRQPTWDDVIAQNEDPSFRNTMKVGEIILDERQRLRSRLRVRGEFIQKPLSEVLLQLATASGIDFSMGSLPSGDPPVTAHFTASPFSAMEQICSQHGVGLYHDVGDPLWVIRKIDPETLIARSYQLHEVHLGSSNSSSENASFGSTYENLSSTGSGSNSNTSTSRRSSSTSSSLTGVNGSSSSGTSTVSSAADDALFQTRFDTPSEVLVTIRSILGLVDKVAMVSELSSGPGEGSGDQGGAARLSTRPTTNSSKVNGLVSYNAEANSLFVVATERQHQWVGEYLKTIDRKSAIIAIDALFVETDMNPTSNTGVNWSESLLNWKVSTANSSANITSSSSTSSSDSTDTDTVSFGSLGHLKWPSGAILTAPSLGATISALLSDSHSRVARYPRAVTANNREVRIASTTNIPIITNAATVSTATTTTSATTTNYSSGTQEIGTIITLLPSHIDGDRVSLKISIEISSGETSTSGETLTGRIPTTSSVYEGEVIIDAGKTLAIGGLERLAETSGIQRVPGLSKIPVFGFLFKNKSVDFRNTNITLFVTPRLLNMDGLPEASQRHDGSAARALHDSLILETKADAQEAESDKDESKSK